MTDFFSQHDDNERLDAELRRVVLPEGMVERIQQGVFGQEQLDQLLCEVQVPDGMTDRLRQIPASSSTAGPAPANPATADPVADPATVASVEKGATSDAPSKTLPSLSVAERIVDSTLGRVNAPSGLTERLRSIPRRAMRRRQDQLRWLQVTLVLFVLFQWALVTVLGRVDRRIAQSDPSSIRLQTIQVSRYDLDVEVPERLIELEVSPNAGGEVANAMPEALAAIKTPWELEQAALESTELATSASDAEKLPEVVRPRLILPRGRPLPLVRGFDRGFSLKNGIRPILFPGRHWEQASSETPVTTSRESFEYARSMIERGGMPKPEQIRVEDFLAAYNPRFFEPSRPEMELSVAGGPSLFGDVNARMLQIGVQAGVTQRVSGPVHLTLVVDASASMRWSGRLRRVQNAIARLLAYGDKEDRVSILLVKQFPQWVVRDQPLQHTPELLRKIRSIEAHGGTDLQSAITLGAGFARSNVHRRRSVLVVLTDAEEVADNGVAGVRGEIEAAASAGVQIQFVSLREGRSPWNVLADWASAAGTELTLSGDDRGLQWPLVEWLQNRPLIQGRNARFEVRFDPMAVLAYRQLGHDPDHFAEGKPIGGTLHDDETASVMFEVWLRPGFSGRIGQVYFSWEDPKTGEQQSIRRMLRRGDFATSVAESAKSLQTAQIVAETAEILRRGFTFELLPDGSVKRRRKTQDVQTVIKKVENLGLRERSDPSFTEWLTFLNDLKKLKQHRRGAGR